MKGFTGILAFLLVCLMVEGSVHDCYERYLESRRIAEQEKDHELVEIYICADEEHYLHCLEKEYNALKRSEYKEKVMKKLENVKATIKQRCEMHIIM